MPENYDNETCEGCLHSAGVVKIEGCQVYDLPEGQHRCDLFFPNLYSREVRTLESINTNLDMLQAVAQEALLIYGNKVK